MLQVRLARLPTPARFAIGAFCLGLLGFHVAAQATLWAQAGEGKLPSAEEVLWKYHGNPNRTKLHEVFDLSLPRSSPRAMFWYLDPTATPEAMGAVEERRKVVLDWVAAGAPRAGWEPVRHVLHDQAMCLECHAPGKEMGRLPFETYEEVLKVAQPGQGMTPGALLVSAHNHLFAFLVAALLLGLGTAFTALRRPLQVGLVLVAFAGAVADVSGWFLTASQGEPWNRLVILGGACFGIATAAMALLVFDEVAFSGYFARRLRLARPDTV